MGLDVGVNMMDATQDDSPTPGQPTKYLPESEGHTMHAMTRSPVFNALPIYGTIVGVYRYIAWLRWVLVWG